MPYAAIIQALIGMVSSAEAGKLTKEQIDIQKKQIAEMAGIPLPQLEKIAATELPPSHVAALGIDPGLRQNQLDTIDALKDIAAGGGMALDDKVAQEAAMSRAAGSARRGRAGIAADLASRGQLNSGAQLQMAMNAEQQNANAARQSGMEAAASAQRRKMEALKEIGGMSGMLRDQDFGEKKAAAQAADERDVWNAGSAERAKYHNADLPEQDFRNRLSKITGQQPGINALSGLYSAEAQGIRNQGAALSAAAGQGMNDFSKWLDSKPKESNDTYSWSAPPMVQASTEDEWSPYPTNQKLHEDDE